MDGTKRHSIDWWPTIMKPMLGLSLQLSIPVWVHVGVWAEAGPASATNVAQSANALGFMIMPYPLLPFSKSIVDAATEDVELVNACARADHLRVEVFTLHGPVRCEAIFHAQASNDARAPVRGRAIREHTKRTARR